MLRFLKIFPAYFQKSKFFQSVSLDYVLFTSAHVNNSEQLINEPLG